MNLEQDSTIAENLALRLARLENRINGYHEDKTASFERIDDALEAKELGQLMEQRNALAKQLRTL